MKDSPIGCYGENMRISRSLPPLISRWQSYLYQNSSCTKKNGIAHYELSRLCWWLKIVYCHVNDPFARADKHSDRESHAIGNEVEMCNCITDIFSDFINQRIITSMTGHADNPPTGAVKHFIMVKPVTFPANRNISDIRFAVNQVERDGNIFVVHVDNIACTNDTYFLFHCLKFIHGIQYFSFSCILNHAHNL